MADILNDILNDVDRVKNLNKKVEKIPQFGTTTLNIPPFFAVPYNKKKRGVIVTAWKLANPLTEIRNLANRQHTKSINLKRANVEEPSLDMSIPREVPKLDDFSESDQQKLRGYFRAVERGEHHDYMFKNRPRGFPVTLYKNARKAGYKETHKKVFRKNDLKPKPVTSGKRGRPKKAPLPIVSTEPTAAVRQEMEEVTPQIKAVEKPPAVSEKPKSRKEQKNDKGMVAQRQYKFLEDALLSIQHTLTLDGKIAERDMNTMMKDIPEQLDIILNQINKINEDDKKRLTELYDKVKEKFTHAKAGGKKVNSSSVSKEEKRNEREEIKEARRNEREEKLRIARERKAKKSVGGKIPTGRSNNIRLNLEKMEDKYDSNSDSDEGHGGSLSTKDLKDLLGASYDPKKDKVGDFYLDKEISSKTSKAYRNKKTGQVVVAHMGTQGIMDWGNNAVYALGGDKAYKQTSRFKEAERVQKKAENKYGAKNVTTIGHSQGGKQAELLGKDTKETITLNKATRPFENKKQENQYDIRTTGDVVSALNPFQKKNKKEIVIKSKTINPLIEHSTDTLEGLDENKIIGEGLEIKSQHYNMKHPALESDLFPRNPQSFTQVHLTHPIPIGRGLYAGSGSGIPPHSRSPITDPSLLGSGVSPHSRSPVTDPSLMDDMEGSGIKKPHLVKGSAAAKAHMAKIRAMRKK
jgi:hypothetical protein